MTSSRDSNAAGTVSHHQGRVRHRHCTDQYNLEGRTTSVNAGCRGRVTLCDRELHRKARAAGSRVDAQLAVVLLSDDVVADREPEPGAFAGGLGREEWIEDPRFDRIRYSGPIVFDLDHGPVVQSPSSHDDRSRAIDRIDGVAQQVGPDLVEFRAVRLELGHIRTVVAADLDTGRQSASQHPEGVVDLLVALDRLQGRLAKVRVSLERADDFGNASRALADLTQKDMRSVLAGDPVEGGR